jgi:hypothetical protein
MLMIFSTIMIPQKITILLPFADPMTSETASLVSGTGIITKAKPPNLNPGKLPCHIE